MKAVRDSASHSAADLTQPRLDDYDNIMMMMMMMMTILEPILIYSQSFMTSDHNKQRNQRYSKPFIHSFIAICRVHYVENV